MLTQSLKKEWNWSDKELKFIEEEKYPRNQGSLIMKNDSTALIKTAEAFISFSTHKDTRQVWNKTRADTHWNITETRTRYRAVQKRESNAFK